MRISVRKDDPGYREDAWKHRVYCDGKEVPLCFTADEEEGAAWGYAYDPNTRNALIDPFCPDELMVREYRGAIEVKRVA